MTVVTRNRLVVAAALFVACMAISPVAFGGGDDTTEPSRPPSSGAETGRSSAVEEADRDLRRRGKRVPDARYATLLEQTFSNSFRSGQFRLYRPSRDPALLGDKRFVRNLRTLFEARSSAGISGSEHNLIDTFVVGGLPIPSATDVVGITGGEDGLDDGFCSGTKIADRLVLTAAHCVCSGTANFVRVGERMSPRNAYRAYRIVKRTLWLDREFCPVRREGEARGDFLVRVQEATRGRDLAVVEIEGTMTLGRARRLLNRQQFDNWRRGDLRYFVRAAGIGFSGISETGEPEGAGLRLYADIAVATHVCSQADAQRFGCVAGKELVAQGHPAHQVEGPTPDTCGGDSGGPIFALVTQGGEKRFYLIGVTSRGTSSACGAGGIYSLASTGDGATWLRAKGASFLQ